MATTLWIDNGINVDPAWGDHIAISRDGGSTWSTVHKSGLHVQPLITEGTDSNRSTSKTTKYRIRLSTGVDEGYKFEFDIENVANQAGWNVGGPVGSFAAVTDLTTWIAVGGSGPGPFATEATLLAVLSAVDNMRDYEVRLVEDSDTPSVTWLEVRYWDAQSGTLGAPVYYPPGSTVAGTPTGGLTYINPNTYLGQILSELTGSALTGNYSVETGLFTIPAGFKAASVFNVGAAAATFDGSSLPAGTGVPIPPIGKNDTYAAMSGDATGTTVLVQYTT